MNLKEKLLTQERLRELMRYDPETGDFWWRKNPPTRKHPMTVPAGVLRAGKYRLIGIDADKYYAHRLAWFYMTDKWPVYIDHRDGNPCNNKWNNLRESTHSQNMANKKRQRDNACGRKGVWLEHNMKYYCQSSRGSVKIRCGPFETADSAYAVYVEIIKILHGEFARAE